MATLKVTNKQLRLIQQALDFYLRVGIGQMNSILDHPTYSHILQDKLRPQKEIEVGDRTEYGEVVEIVDDWIKTKGTWGGEEEIRTYTKEEVKLSVDWTKYHSIQANALKILNKGRNELLQENFPDTVSYGINNSSVDESCRVAYDIFQVIRHELWKKEDEKDLFVRASSVLLSTDEANKIKCEVD